MRENELAIGQVGCTGPEDIIGFSEWVVGRQIPRVAIIEPDHQLCSYNGPNQWCEDTAMSTGNLSIRTDIYKPIPTWHAPPLGFLLFENVLNDLGYLGKKDVVQLGQNLETMMSSGGLVLVIDSIYPSDLRRPYIPLNHAMKDHSFVLILDEITEQFIHPSFRRNDYLQGREGLLLDRLSALHLLDKPLRNGIMLSAKDAIQYWMLYQRE